jgi:uncharacterized protein (UPF0332 family)
LASAAVERWMSKAEANIRIARACCDLGYMDAAANRAYYAVVHAQAATLTSRGEPGLVSPYLEKERLNQAFERLLRTDRKFAGIGNPYTSAKKARTTADYRSGTVSAALAREILKEVELLLSAVRANLE